MSLQAELARLIAYPTVSNRPVTELAAYVAANCEDLGFRVERFDDPCDSGKCSLVASIGPPGTEGLILSGHMDVVPTENQPWSSDPFALAERDGKLYGRGTADMKGFLAVVLEALHRIPRQDFRRELLLIWTHDEEVGCLGSKLVAEALGDLDRPLPAGCLIGEPTSFRIVRMHPGHATVHIDVHGQAAHSSRPDLGLNAIEAMAEIVRAASALARELEGERADHLTDMERPWVAMNVARVGGGSAVNIVPDRCWLELDYRPLPGMRPEQVFERLCARLADLELAAHVDPRLVQVTPAMLTPADTPLQRLLEPFASVPGTSAATFATDGGNLARLGVAPLVFGPGSIEVAHQADEYIEVAELVRAVDVIESLVRDRCCAPR